MTKSEFVDRVADQAGIGKNEATKAVDATLQVIEETLSRGGEVSSPASASSPSPSVALARASTRRRASGSRSRPARCRGSAPAPRSRAPSRAAEPSFPPGPHGPGSVSRPAGGARRRAPQPGRARPRPRSGPSVAGGDRVRGRAARRPPARRRTRPARSRPPPSPTTAGWRSRRPAPRASRSSSRWPASSGSARPAGTPLEDAAATARDHGLLVIADGKRGDVPVTAVRLRAGPPRLHASRRSARFPGFGADAITVNPLLGRDALEPLIVAAVESGAGVFVLVRTSNPGGADLQDRELEGRPLLRGARRP